jgi:RNA polymerase-binding transcription factor DksA
MPTRLDAPSASHLSPDQLERLRRLLADEHTAQQARAVELQDPVDLEPDLAGVLLARCQEAMDEIDAALTRLRAGSYGLCLACDGAIPYERLEIVPAADHCVACQADRDRVLR